MDPNEGPGRGLTGHAKIVRARHEVASRVVPAVKGRQESNRVSGQEARTSLEEDGLASA